MNLPAKLSDTQFAILVEASQRKDRCLIAPKTLKAAAAQKVAAKLLTAGLVREIKAKAGMEAWRRDQETGRAYSLKLIDAGLKAIAVDERGSQSVPNTAVPQNTKKESSKANTTAKLAAARSAAALTSAAPRQGSKIAHVVELLQRDQGAKLDELIAATGWLPHTARAALTGFATAATTSTWSVARTGALRSTAPWRPSQSLRNLDSIEWEELSAAADGNFGRRAAWTDRRVRRSQP
jgi:hypothetical protein